MYRTFGIIINFNKKREKKSFILTFPHKSINLHTSIFFLLFCFWFICISHFYLSSKKAKKKSSSKTKHHMGAFLNINKKCEHKKMFFIIYATRGSAPKYIFFLFIKQQNVKIYSLCVSRVYTFRFAYLKRFHSGKETTNTYHCVA